MSEMDWKTRVYHALPAFGRNAVATVRGCQLEYLRRGRDFEQLVDEYLERENWSRQQWQQWQSGKLREMLRWAAREVPYYRRYWQEHAPRNHEAAVEEISNWPVLEKNILRKQPHLFLADSSSLKNLHAWHTSGSTGSPTTIWWSKKMMRRRWAAFEARSRRWYGVSYRDPFALLGGRMVAPIQQRKPPFWVWNAASRQLYMSSYHLSRANIPFYVEEMKRRSVKHIYGYTSSIFEIANYLLETSTAPPQLKVIVTQAEPLYEHQRRVIEKAFNCPVRESYGMAEMVAQAGECEHGTMHLWPEYGYCEVDTGDGLLATVGTGDLVTTGLLNWDMPLIRYRLGDRVTLGSSEETCSCGRHLPILGGVEGRIDDVLLTPDGRKVGRLSTVFKNLPIMEAQTIQRSLDRILLKVVPGDGYDAACERALIQALCERMGDIQVDVELVEAIPRGANGKFRAVLCELGKH
jgi:phenylacetate-CoA ligase